METPGKREIITEYGVGPPLASKMAGTLFSREFINRSLGWWIMESVDHVNHSYADQTTVSRKMHMPS